MKPQNLNQGKQRGFSLVEMLVVIAIIGVLAAITFGLSQIANQKAITERARVELQEVSKALDAYRDNEGDYPTNAYTSRNELYYLLCTSSNGFNNKTSTKIYFTPRETMFSSSTSGALLDPLKNPYGYAYPGTNHNLTGFDLWSPVTKGSALNSGNLTAYLQSTVGNSSNIQDWVTNWQ